MASVLKYHHKGRIHKRYTVEMILYEVSRTNKYPQGVRYRLICFDQKSNKRVLMDNHHPKGHHIHINEDAEFKYNFISEDKLFEDFKKLVLDHMEVKL